jgi:hypothetical protein
VCETFLFQFSTDNDTKRDYKFYNKPFGMRHWLYYGDHGSDHGSDHGPFGVSRMAPAVVALIDPDELFLRPLSSGLGTATNLLVSSPVKASVLREQWPVVAEGRPAGQFYGDLSRPFFCTSCLRRSLSLV